MFPFTHVHVHVQRPTSAVSSTKTEKRQAPIVFPHPPCHFFCHFGAVVWRIERLLIGERLCCLASTWPEMTLQAI